MSSSDLRLSCRADPNINPSLRGTDFLFFIALAEEGAEEMMLFLKQLSDEGLISGLDKSHGCSETAADILLLL